MWYNVGEVILLKPNWEESSYIQLDLQATREIKLEKLGI